MLPFHQGKFILSFAGEIMKAVIKVENLSKTFGNVTAVDHMDLAVLEGELFGLLGPNGSGKSTTIRLLTGQIKPNEGNISLLGTDVLSDPVGVRSAVGIIPEQETPPSFLTAEEYLYFVAEIRGLSEDLEEKCGFWFDFLEFDDKRNQLCKDLSRGTRQKLMFAQAFLHQPKLALIDEPLINLDPVMQRKVKDYLMEYTGNGGTIFISTHILAIAEEICSSVGIIHNGNILYQGGVADLKAKHDDLEAFFINLVRNG
jgi:ABC-2 type transport system ATP-binding protein